MPKLGYLQTPEHRRKLSLAAGGKPPRKLGKTTFLSQTTVRKKSKAKKGQIAAHPKKKGITKGKPTPQSTIRNISHKKHEQETKRAKK